MQIFVNEKHKYFSFMNYIALQQILLLTHLLLKNSKLKKPKRKIKAQPKN